MTSTPTFPRWLLPFCVLLTLSIAYLGYEHVRNPKPRLAYVDSQRLLDSYQGMVTARRQYQRLQQDWQHNLDQLAQEAQRAQQQAASLPLARSARLQQVAQLKQQQYASYQQVLAQQQPIEMQRLTQPVLNHVNRFMLRYGKAQGYDFIFATTETGAMLYANPARDLTADVAAELNRNLQDSLRIH